MTREEAKDEYYKITERGIIFFNEKGIIDKIYDDFESRTCGSCKYWIKFSDKHDLRRCSGENGCEITGEKFFCANWEKVNV